TRLTTGEPYPTLFCPMLLRLFLGLAKGGLGGVGFAAAIVFGREVSTMTGLLQYAAVLITAICVALIAGRPVWVRGAWVEVLLKSIAAAAVGIGLLYALRNYVDVTVDWGRLGA